MTSIFDYKGQCRVWDFRASKDVLSSEILLNKLPQVCRRFVFQLERGDGGYEHWQGRLNLIKPRRGGELAKLLEALELPLPNYIAPTAKVNHDKEAFYCLKFDTRIDGPWTDKDTPEYVPWHLRKVTELYPWQQTLISSGLDENRDDRIVDCIVDQNGCSGKSTVASLGELKHGHTDMPTVNDGTLLTATLCDILTAQQNRKPRVIYFDMPRSQSKDKLYGLFTAIEQVKKGKVFDLRYSYKCWWFDSPRIWVFANEFPDVRYLSMDRWRFWHIDPQSQMLVRASPPEND